MFKLQFMEVFKILNWLIYWNTVVKKSILYPSTANAHEYWFSFSNLQQSRSLQRDYENMSKQVHCMFQAVSRPEERCFSARSLFLLSAIQTAQEAGRGSCRRPGGEMSLMCRRVQAPPPSVDSLQVFQLKFKWQQEASAPGLATSL